MTARVRLPSRRAAEHFSFRCNGLAYAASIGRFPDGRADAFSRAVIAAVLEHSPRAFDEYADTAAPEHSDNPFWGTS